MALQQAPAEAVDDGDHRVEGKEQPPAGHVARAEADRGQEHAELEEERRLFYVAVTRAKDELYLSYPFMRGGFGNSGDTFQTPSRFLNEIPRDLINEWNVKPTYY